MGCMCAERAGRGDCWAALCHLWKVSANGKGTWRLEDGQCYFSLQKGQEGSGKQIRPVVLTSIPWKVWDSLAAGSSYLLVFNFTCSPSSQIHWSGVFLLTPLRTPTLLRHIFTELGKWPSLGAWLEKRFLLGSGLWRAAGPRAPTTARTAAQSHNCRVTCSHSVTKAVSFLGVLAVYFHFLPTDLPNISHLRLL